MEMQYTIIIKVRLKSIMKMCINIGIIGMSYLMKLTNIMQKSLQIIIKIGYSKVKIILKRI